jgi:hypothetical protein
MCPKNFDQQAEDAWIEVFTPAPRPKVIVELRRKRRIIG